MPVLTEPNIDQQTDSPRLPGPVNANLLGIALGITYLPARIHFGNPYGFLCLAIPMGLRGS